MLHGANPGLVGSLPFEEGSPNACARSTMPFSVAGPDESRDWSVSKQWIHMFIAFQNLFVMFCLLVRLNGGNDLTVIRASDLTREANGKIMVEFLNMSRPMMYSHQPLPFLLFCMHQNHVID